MNCSISQDSSFSHISQSRGYECYINKVIIIIIIIVIIQVIIIITIIIIIVIINIIEGI